MVRLSHCAYNICSTFTAALEGHTHTHTRGRKQFHLEGVVVVVVAAATEENFALATAAEEGSVSNTGRY